MPAAHSYSRPQFAVPEKWKWTEDLMHLSADAPEPDTCLQGSSPGDLMLVFRTDGFKEQPSLRLTAHQILCPVSPSVQGCHYQDLGADHTSDLRPQPSRLGWWGGWRWRLQARGSHYPDSNTDPCPGPQRRLSKEEEKGAAHTDRGKQQGVPQPTIYKLPKDQNILWP